MATHPHLWSRSHRKLTEIGVLHSFFGSQPLLMVVSQEFVQKVQDFRADQVSVLTMDEVLPTFPWMPASKVTKSICCIETTSREVIKPSGKNQRSNTLLAEVDLVCSFASIFQYHWQNQRFTSILEDLACFPKVLKMQKFPEVKKKLMLWSNYLLLPRVTASPCKKNYFTFLM